jgi:hypothetical protein
VTRAVAIACVALALAAGCGSNVCGPFNGQPCIALHLGAAAGAKLPPLDEIDVDIAGALHASSRKPGGGAASLPIVLAILPGMALSDATIVVTARANGTVEGEANVMASVTAKQHVDVQADLVSLAGRDMNGGQDLSPLVDGYVVVGAPCSLLMPTTCTAGEKCTLANNGSFCAADGTAMAGEACSGVPDNCVHGTVCVGGVCHPLCSSDADCTQPAVNSVAPRCTVPLPGLLNKACTIACNPVLNAGASLCPTGTACVYTPSPTSEATDCAPPGSDTEGTSCTNSTQCGANLTCILNGAPPSLCRAVCRNGMSGDMKGDCSGSDTCQAVGTQYGVCCPSGGC